MCIGFPGCAGNVPAPCDFLPFLAGSGLLIFPSRWALFTVGIQICTEVWRSYCGGKQQPGRRDPAQFTGLSTRSRTEYSEYSVLTAACPEEGKLLIKLKRL